MDKTWLIHKVLSGKASESENAELNEWVESDPGNKEDYEDIKFLYNNARIVDDKIKRDDRFYDGLRKIEGRIEVLKRHGKKIKFYKTLSAIMGIFVVVISALLYYEDSTGSDGNSRLNLESGRLTDNMRFNEAELESIIKVLEEKYGLAFNVKSEKLLSCRFTGTFSRGVPINDMIRTLAQSEGFDFKIINTQKYELNGKGCN